MSAPKDRCPACFVRGEPPPDGEEPGSPRSAEFAFVLGWALGAAVSEEALCELHAAGLANTRELMVRQYLEQGASSPKKGEPS